MATLREKLDALEAAAEERSLTPVAWWIGDAHQAALLEELDPEEIQTRAGRLVGIEGREVKLLTETPQRLALWCKEGVLEL